MEANLSIIILPVAISARVGVSAKSAASCTKYEENFKA